MMKRIHFFATPADITPVLQRFEQNEPLKFVEIGVFNTPNLPIYLESSEIPNPGIATDERGGGSIGYLVSYRDSKNQITPFINHENQKCWSLDNGNNEETVVLKMAGMWKKDILLPGIMDTLHDTPVAQQLMKWFLAALKKQGFVKEQGWWLGSEAMAMLKAGKRLTTTAEQSPPEYDLKVPGEPQTS